jgi:hypothetical protein
MQITDYEFGRISIEGHTYTSDVIILPDEVRDSWWRREGHSLHIEDLADVIEAQPDVLVVGTGCYGRMQIPPETLTHLESRGIEVVAAPTGDVVGRFNDLQRRHGKTVAALHLSC